MEKTFNKETIIPIEDYFVVVDNTQTTNGNARYWVSGEDGIGRVVTHLDTKLIGWPVVATTGKRIGDIPLVELSDEIEEELQEYMRFEDAALEVSKSIIFDPNVFCAGNPFTFEQRSELRLQRLKDLGIWPLKANKGKYSQEDMLKIFEAGRNFGFVECAEGYGVPYGDRNRPLNCEAYLKSLQAKRPISITLEYEEIIETSGIDYKQMKIKDSGFNKKEYLKLKVSKDNTVKPLEVKHE